MNTPKDTLAHCGFLAAQSTHSCSGQPKASNESTNATDRFNEKLTLFPGMALSCSSTSLAMQWLSISAYRQSPLAAPNHSQKLNK
jgi:hypothetical protein